MKKTKRKCHVCGIKVVFEYKEVLPDELVKQWGLNKKQRFLQNKKESMTCPNCNCSFRVRMLALAVMNEFGFDGVDCFRGWVDKANARGLKVSEINFCGGLHNELKRIKKLKSSQYESGNLREMLGNWWNGIGREDIMKLSYESDSFDLVLHSEVLEHILDLKKAVKEIKRVLKKGGVSLFTIPIIKGRKTKRRATLLKGRVVNTLDPSYHGSGEKGNLVVSEFGDDIIKKMGFDVVIEKDGTYVLAIRK